MDAMVKATDVSYQTYPITVFDQMLINAVRDEGRYGTDGAVIREGIEALAYNVLLPDEVKAIRERYIDMIADGAE